jgi:hypothetical protein
MLSQAMDSQLVTAFWYLIHVLETPPFRDLLLHLGWQMLRMMEHLQLLGVGLLSSGIQPQPLQLEANTGFAGVQLMTSLAALRKISTLTWEN